MKATHLLARPIPWRVVLLAWWFMSGRAVRQKLPSTETRLARSWTRAKAARATHVKAPIGQAIRWALYDWRPCWTEADLVQATADITRRLDARRVTKAKNKARLRAREYRAAFNAELRGHRAKHAGQHALAATDRYLAIAQSPDPIQPALAREIRSRVFQDPDQARPSLYLDGRWWSSRAAYERWKAKPPQPARPAASEIAPPAVTRRNGVTARNGAAGHHSRGVSMGQLAALAAEMNGKRL